MKLRRLDPSHRLLTAEEERTLSARIHGDDLDDRIVARNVLVEHNLRLVTKMARRFTAFGLPMLDLVQEGTIGLIEAADRFDAKAYTNRFATYATWWIRQSLCAAIEKRSTIRIPKHILNFIHGAEKTRRDLLKKHPGIEKLAEKAARTKVISESQSREKLSAAIRILAEGQSGDSNEVEAKDERDRLWRAIRHLTARQRTILLYRFELDGHEPKSLVEIGEILGISKERVRQLEHESIQKLRKLMCA